MSQCAIEFVFAMLKLLKLSRINRFDESVALCLGKILVACVALKMFSLSSKQI